MTALSDTYLSEIEAHFKWHECGECEEMSAALIAEVRRLRDRNSRLQQKCNSLSNNTVKEADLKKILDVAEKAPGGFAKDHEYGCVNIIGKAQLRKDLSCCIRLEDLSFFSGAKATIRRLANEVQRLRTRYESTPKTPDVPNTWLTTNGKDYACKCGCKLFNQPNRHILTYRCNACGVEHEGMI